MNNPKIENTLLENAEQARKSEIKSTPSFLIGDTKIRGTRTYKKFKRIIEDELKKQSNN